MSARPLERSSTRQPPQGTQTSRLHRRRPIRGGYRVATALSSPNAGGQGAGRRGGETDADRQRKRAEERQTGRQTHTHTHKTQKAKTCRWPHITSPVADEKVPTARRESDARDFCRLQRKTCIIMYYHVCACTRERQRQEGREGVYIHIIGTERETCIRCTRLSLLTVTVHTSARFRGWICLHISL